MDDISLEESVEQGISNYLETQEGLDENEPIYDVVRSSMNENAYDLVLKELETNLMTRIVVEPGLLPEDESMSAEAAYFLDGEGTLNTEETTLDIRDALEYDKKYLSRTDKVKAVQGTLEYVGEWAIENMEELKLSKLQI